MPAPMAPGSDHSSLGYSVLSEVALEGPFWSLPWMMELAADGQGQGKDFLTAQVCTTRDHCFLSPGPRATVLPGLFAWDTSSVIIQIPCIIVSIRNPILTYLCTQKAWGRAALKTVALV